MYTQNNREHQGQGVPEVEQFYCHQLNAEDSYGCTVIPTRKNGVLEGTHRIVDSVDELLFSLSEIDEC